MKKWVNVRDAFRKSSKKQKDAAKSGAGAPTAKTYVYNAQLQFLNKVFKERQTKRSLPGNITHPDTSDEERPQETPETEVTQARAKARNKSEPRKRKLDEVELEMLKALKQTPDDRHLSFFKGIIPSLNSFDDDEILHFQTTVLQTITSIKHRKKTLFCNQHSTLSYAVQVNPSQLPVSTTKSHPYSNISLVLPTNQHTFNSSHLPTTSNGLNNQHHIMQPMRQYYETIGEHVSQVSEELLSPSSQSSQESFDFSV